jgi:hypothetical protein
MLCENDLYIEVHTVEEFEKLLNLLGDAELLFQTFVPLTGTKKECYGTESDVYLEHNFSEHYDNILHFTFYTHDTPCINFCTQLTQLYNVSIQLIYFNEKFDISGELNIHHSVTKYTHYGYLQGVYIHKPDLFWGIIEFTFERSTFMEFLEKRKLHVFENDFKKLNTLFDKYIVFTSFEHL